MALKIVKSKQATDQAFLKMALYGKAGSGKTLTSLLVAEGLSAKRGKPILFIDSEDGTAWYRRDIPERTVHPEAFEFDLLLTKSISEVNEALDTVGKDYGVVVIDSVTHLWEAAQAAYTGKKTSTGSVPIQAWSTIKKPWKRMISLGLDGDFDLILCGREGVLMEEGADGEVKVVGARMKSESEAPFEPHILARMIPERTKEGATIIRIYFEKDRSGVLSGRTLEWPNFDTFAPLVGYLSGGAQPKMGSTDAAAERDAEAIAAEAERAENERRDLFNTIRQALLTARNADELRAAWSLTTGKKSKLGDAFADLEAVKDGRKAELIREVA